MNSTIQKSLAEYDTIRAAKQMAYNAGILSEKEYMGFLLKEDTLWEIIQKNRDGRK